MKTDGKGTITEGYHPSADSAMQYIRSLGILKLSQLQESYASCAIEGNELAEVCLETLNRLQKGEPVSDRYLLGLAWNVKMMEEGSKEL